jgi:hypothetical protein
MSVYVEASQLAGNIKSRKYHEELLNSILKGSVQRELMGKKAVSLDRYFFKDIFSGAIL